MHARPFLDSIRSLRHGGAAPADLHEMVFLLGPWPRRDPAAGAKRSLLRVVGVRFGAEAEAASVPRSVPVRVPYEPHQAGHRYLDVRTEAEFSAGYQEFLLLLLTLCKNTLV
ncbi:hypothetical protein PAHAL_2G378200 [Panicum hallii]|uniref:Uncharacterized protein n=1 Tax=Panicum hallii TaxID=206008 RepID=A0A2T8KRW2_9POAL|nr:hypothetical protein PAHAL_2G378200 [Panicum hallii]